MDTGGYTVVGRCAQLQCPLCRLRHVEADGVAKRVGEASDDAGDQHELSVECGFGDPDDQAEAHD